MHPYQKIAVRAFYKVERQSHYWQNSSGLRLCRQDKIECINEAVLRLCEIAADKPKFKDNEAYLFAVAKIRIIEFLFGKHGESDRHKGYLSPNKQVSFEGWLIMPSGKYSPDDFTERNFSRIYETLLNARKKKGARGEAAALRDLQIIRLASLGWSNAEIAEELNLPHPHVKDYRKKIVKLLKNLVQE